MARPLRAKLAILGMTAQLATLGLSASVGAARAQGFFGEAPPRPPVAVPGGQTPARSSPPEPLPPPPGVAARPRGLGTEVESQPLPPPPGMTDPGQAPSAALPPSAPLPPGPGSAPPPAARATPPPGSPGPPVDEVVTEPPTQKMPNPTAVFSGLDKITGRITTFDVAMNETVQFGALRVRPRACFTRPPTEAPNTTGFIEVDEVTLQGEVKRLFRGWMFAASPGLHGVEHSIYDVWLADCKGAQTAAVEEPAPPPAQQPSQPARRAQPTPSRSGDARRSASPQRPAR